MKQTIKIDSATEVVIHKIEENGQYIVFGTEWKETQVNPTFHRKWGNHIFLKIIDDKQEAEAFYRKKIDETQAKIK